MAPEFTETLVGEIVARLEALGPAGARVERWPETTTKGRTVQGKAELWVGYTGSRYSKPEAFGLIQQRMPRIMVAVRVRNLHGPHGAGNYVDAVRDLLHGYQPTLGGSQLYCVEDKFRGEANGIWSYTIEFEFDVPVVPLEDSTPTSPTLVRMTLEDNHGNTTEITSS